MRAWCLEAPRQACVRQVAEPTAAPGEVVVRIRACGVCGSDLNAWRGVPGIEYPLPPGAPGHEVWGDVAALGQDVTGLRVGQSVTGLLWNGLAELGVARAEHLVPIPANTPILGEPLACAANVVRRAAIAPGQRVGLVGFGYLAALIVHLLPEHMGGWLAVSRRPESRALAQELGAHAVYDFDAVPSDLWDSLPVVIEAAGVQQTLDHATWLVSYGGRLVIAGYHADGSRTVNVQTWNWKGIDVINAHEREPATYVSALRTGLDLAQRRRVPLERLITHNWPLDQAADAFVAAETRPSGFIKGIVTP